MTRIKSRVMRGGDELAIRVDARLSLELQLDHDHGDGKLVPMVEEEDRAEISDASAARVYYKCLECGECVAVGAVAHRPGDPEVAFGSGD